ncbi:MAG: 50S ribosomal protein L25 [Myxococcales bacterium]|nr:50S ribosomal protein L25 [Myxococcales bacterium]
MSEVTWKVTVRKSKGKGGARKLRCAGNLPAVAYGRDVPATPIAVSEEVVDQFLHQPNWNQNLVKLEADDPALFVDKYFMIREIQRHHIDYHPLSLDLVAVRLDQKIKIEVPLEVKGAAEIKKLGGILEIQHRTLAIKCFVTKIPSKIEVDATALQIGHTMHLKDITLPEGVETDLAPDYPICSAIIPREVSTEPAAAAATAEGAAAEGAAAAAPAAGDKEKKEGQDKGK